MAVSVVGATTFMVNEPAAATTDFTTQVASAVAATAVIIELAVTRLLVTTIEVAPAAIFTRPALLFMVCAPVVPGAITVAPNVNP